VLRTCCFQKAIGNNWSVSSDYVHTLGIHEPRFQNVTPRIESVCNPACPGATPASPRCVRGINSRYFDQAFVAAGLPANRLEQINMFTGTNRSLFDSWTTTVKGRFGRSSAQLSYVLASSRSWGGQPTASCSGNGIAIDAEFQFDEEEFGPTRLDERHRIVASAVLELPLNFQIAPIVQYASARPYSLNTGFDLDGDGLVLVDRLCADTNPSAVFAARGNLAALRALNPRRLHPGPGEPAARRVRGESRRQRHRDERPLLQCGRARHQELQPRPARAIPGSTPTSTTCSTPTTSTSATTAAWP
jgi:hypothetical protein